MSAWPGVLHNSGSQHVITVSGSSPPPHISHATMPSLLLPAAASILLRGNWYRDLDTGHMAAAAGAWLVLTPSVSNISTPAHVSLTKQIFLLTPNIFTAFYDVARGNSSRCLLLLEGWHVLCSANGIVSFKFVAINNHCPVSIISLHHIWSLLL